MARVGSQNITPNLITPDRTTPTTMPLRHTKQDGLPAARDRVRHRRPHVQSVENRQASFLRCKTIFVFGVRIKKKKEVNYS